VSAIRFTAMRSILAFPRRLQLTYAMLVASFITLIRSVVSHAEALWAPVSMSNTTVPPGAVLDYLISVRNVGDTAADGSAVTVTVRLPPGLAGVSFHDDTSSFSCPGIAGSSVIVCTGSPTIPQNGGYIVLTLTTSVDGAAPEGVGSASVDVDGGGAAATGHTVDPVTITTAAPVFGIDAFDGLVSDAAGDPFTQAGGHPYALLTSFDFNTHTDPSPIVGSVSPVEDAKDVVVELPPGLVGNPANVGECTIPELANGKRIDPKPLCAATSQVGVTDVRGSGGVLLGPVPVFNMTPPPGVPARFGFNVDGTIVVLDASVRSGDDYGLTVRGKNIPQGLSIVGNSFTFWGVPSDRSHDAQRACPGQKNPWATGPTCQSGAAPTAFFRNPTSCTTPGVGLTTTVSADSWAHPGVYKQRSFVTHLLPGYPFTPAEWGPVQGPDGCEESVPFDPVLSGQPVAGTRAGTPASFTFDVTIPQNDDPDKIAQSDLRKAVVTLPEGVRVSPSSADGLGGCSLAQIALRSSELPACPGSSQLGEVTIDTPLLREQVTGHVYLAAPFDNPFGSLLGVYIVASARGVVIKLPGQVSANSTTGQLTATFDNNPQLPFSRLHLAFRGGNRAPLVTPRRCGTYVTHAVLTGWNGRTVTSDSNFTLSENAKGRPCPPEFSPGFSAGTESNGAGLSSPFLMRFTRDDEDQDMSGLTVHMAKGLTGRIADVDLCSASSARVGRCSEGSRIGDVTVGAGPGANPFFITNGRAYLTGPYKRAPYGASIVVPAVAGPFDLGNVNVRAAVFVDKHDATVRIVSDPLPTILQGIPLDVRDVRVSINKPRFWLNPTSCAVKTINATLKSTEGLRANVTDRFQAGDCASLAFKPRMVMRVGGRGHTHRGQTSPFTTTLTMPRGDQANLRFVRVSLPTTINARLNTINDACTRAEFEADITKCSHARAGSATAVTPLLREPLRGSVYFVKNGHPIPDLFVALRGQVAFDLIGRITIPGGKHLATTFATAPDVPIRSFTLRLLGGPRTASIGAARNLCSAQSRRATASVDYIAQNGKVLQLDQHLKVAGCGGGGRHRRH
jgi:uncharacterized repeat protein (TIGR01451 family)